MSFRNRGAVITAVVLALVGLAFLGSSTGQSAASAPRGPSSSAAAASRPSNDFGFSPAVQAKIDRLNAELDRCLLAQGAERVPLAGGGWTYTDPGARPSRGCAEVQSRVNAYAASEEYRAAVAAVLPAVQAYAACLARQGVAEAERAARTPEEQSAQAKAHIACGGTAADATAAG